VLVRLQGNGIVFNKDDEEDGKAEGVDDPLVSSPLERPLIVL